MLVLKRRAGERIDLTGGIVVKVVAVEGNFVKLAFEAPPDVTIMRHELIEKAAKNPCTPPENP